MGRDNNQDPFTNKDLWPCPPIIFGRTGNFAVNQLLVPDLFHQTRISFGGHRGAPLERQSARG
jgi:hypothetical protein